jgi:hypothetical protein
MLLKGHMRLRTRLWRLAGGLAVISALYAFQRPFREYAGVEYENFPLPPDWQEKTEWVFARLMYPEIPGASRGYLRYGSGEWRHGYSIWTQDYPRADRHFSQALRRLTRVHVRSVEQPVNLDDGDDVFNWPWIYATHEGEWALTDSQVAKLRDYLLRGGFFMADDFHGSVEWAGFEAGIKRVFPDRPIVEIENSDPIFHTVYDLDDRFQIVGRAFLWRGYKNDGLGGHWRAILDDKGRIMVAISFNSDTGDAWEWADDASYPEKFSGLAMRMGVNYVVYAMTH